MSFDTMRNFTSRYPIYHIVNMSNGGLRFPNLSQIHQVDYSTHKVGITMYIISSDSSQVINSSCCEIEIKHTYI